MYCTYCGEKNEDTALQCVGCSAQLGLFNKHLYRIEDDPGMRIILPVGRSGLAIAAGYVGLFSLMILPAPFALCLGIWAIIDIRKHPDKHGMGRAVFAIIMGAIFSIPLVIIAASLIASIFG